MAGVSSVPRAALIVNPKAGSSGKHLQALLEECLKYPGLEVWETGSVRLEERIAQAKRRGVKLLIAAGGDGTFHKLVNAIGGELGSFRLGVIPLGTGNDLARSLGVPLEPLEALKLALEGEGETWIDLIRVIDSDGRATLCVNHATGGIGGKIEEGMDPGQKRRWKKLAYLRKAAELVADPQGFDLRLKLDDQWLEPGRAMNIVIGNGRTAGGGFRVAPNADLADSYLDVVVAREAPLASMIGASARLLAGDYTKSPEVDQFRARHVRAETQMAFSVDGELFSRGTTEFRVLPRALRLAYAFERLRRTA